MRNLGRNSRLSAAMALALATTMWSSPVSAASAGNGRACTIVGTEAGETIVGTEGPDVICGLGGDDRIFGLGASDVLDGGDGNDSLIAGPGHDWMLGGPGNDWMQGAGGDNRFTGGAGIDTVNYSDAWQPVSVDIDGLRDDHGTNGLDRVDLDVENLVGGRGEDRLVGSSGTNVLMGGPGRDVLDGGAGNDRLDGGSGDDELIGGSGDDSLTGGSGNDLASYRDHRVPVVADLDGVRDDGAVGELDLLGSDIEGLVGGAAGDLLSGSPAGSSLWGLGGADQLFGSDGPDALFGGDGADQLFAGGSVDALDGEAGDDQLFAGAGDDRLRGGDGDDQLHGDDGDDVLEGGAGADTFDGGAGVNACRPPVDVGDIRLASCDTAAPRIAYIGVAPASVWVGGRFTVAVHVVDAGPVERVRVFTEAGVCADRAYLYSGTNRDGVWRSTCKVPTYTAVGDYAVEAVAMDWAGNTVDGRTDPAAASGSVHANYDIVPPVVQSVSVWPAVVHPGDTVTITTRATDAYGVSRVFSSLQFHGRWLAWCNPTGTLASGTTLNGVWRMVCTVPMVVSSGTYVVHPGATDRYRNTTDGMFSDQVPTASFVVVGGSSDVTGPRFRSLTVSPTTVARGHTVTVSARVTDPSGVASVHFTLGYDSGDGWEEACSLYAATLVSGTARDGVWRASCTVRWYAWPNRYRGYGWGNDIYGNGAYTFDSVPDVWVTVI